MEELFDKLIIKIVILTQFLSQLFGQQCAITERAIIQVAR